MYCRKDISAHFLEKVKTKESSDALNTAEANNLQAGKYSDRWKNT